MRFRSSSSSSRAATARPPPHIISDRVRSPLALSRTLLARRLRRDASLASRATPCPRARVPRPRRPSASASPFYLRSCALRRPRRGPPAPSLARWLASLVRLSPWPRLVGPFLLSRRVRPRLWSLPCSVASLSPFPLRRSRWLASAVRGLGVSARSAASCRVAAGCPVPRAGCRCLSVRGVPAVRRSRGRGVSRALVAPRRVGCVLGRLWAHAPVVDAAVARLGRSRPLVGAASSACGRGASSVAGAVRRAAADLSRRLAGPVLRERAWWYTAIRGLLSSSVPAAARVCRGLDPGRWSAPFARAPASRRRWPSSLGSGGAPAFRSVASGRVISRGALLELVV